MGISEDRGPKRRRKDWNRLDRTQQLARVIMGLNRIAEKAVQMAQNGKNTSELLAGYDQTSTAQWWDD